MILGIIASAIKRIAAALGFTSPTTDPYWDNVVLSLRMESSDPYYNQVVLGMHMDDTGLTDVKGNVITLNGNVARSATQSKFGGYSAYFDGTGDYLSVPYSSYFDLSGSTSFTLECWIYINAASSLNTSSLRHAAIFTAGIQVSGNTAYTVVTVLGDGSVTGTGLAFDTFCGGVNKTATFTYSFGTGAWYHIAISREAGNSIKLFINGIQVTASSDTVGSLAIDTPFSNPVTIGGQVATGYNHYLNGYIDDLRITKGVVRYTKNFSIPTAAFPEPANTAIDDKGKTVTTVGGAQYSGLSKYGSGSFYFDGAGDYLSIAPTSDFNFGTGDFTIELWWRPSTFATAQPIIYHTDDSGITGSGEFAIIYNTTLGMRFYLNAGAAGTVSQGNVSGWSINTWYHISIVRAGTTLTIYRDGISIASGTCSAQVGSSSVSTYIGGETFDPLYSTGYIDDLRITKGVARYTANFTPYKILTTAPAGDPLYNYTSLLLKMNGTNGSTTFTDESYAPKTMTVFGNSNISTAQLKYGTASGYFDGTGDYLTTPYNASFAPTGDFTCECWVYSTNAPSLRAIIGPYSYPSLIARGWLLYTGTSGELAVAIRASNGDSQVFNSAAGIVQINKWHHIAWTRSGNVYTIWLDGVSVASGAATVTLYVDPGHPLLIGRWDDAGTNTRDWQGYIDDVRLTNGVARYTATFQPPGPHIAAIDPNTDQWWLHTVLALRMDGTHGSTTFTDLKGNTVTPYGNASISSAVSKFGQAAYFDGTGDYLSIPTSTNFDFGSGDFTIECWFMALSVPGVGGRAIVSRGWTSSGYGTFLIYQVSGTGNILFYASSNDTSWDIVNGTVITASPTLNTWYHIAVARNGSSFRLFSNGTLTNTTTSSGTLLSASTQVFVGGSTNTVDSFNGYIDDVRLTKGIARYTAAFTPSEKPLPTYVVGPDHDQYWDKVVLACPFDTNANDARNHTPTLVGNAGVSNVQKMFGTGSAYFDGTGDYITFPDSNDWHLASNNFTIEAWIRPTGYPVLESATYQSAIITQDLDTSRSFSIILSGAATYINKLSFFGFSDNTTYTEVSGFSSFELNTWHHIAIVRNGNLIFLFVNGICLNPGGTAFSQNIQNSTTTLKIGAQIYTSSSYRYFTGYIDDVRITKGVGRYTANFELPTVANILG